MYEEEIINEIERFIAEKNYISLETVKKFYNLYQKEKEKNKLQEKTLIEFANEREKILSTSVISKNKIKTKIKEKQDRINKLHPVSDIVIIDDLENQIKVLQELLEE